MGNTSHTKYHLKKIKSYRSLSAVTTAHLHPLPTAVSSLTTAQILISPPTAVLAVWSVQPSQKVKGEGLWKDNTMYIGRRRSNRVISFSLKHSEGKEHVSCLLLNNSQVYVGIVYLSTKVAYIHELCFCTEWLRQKSYKVVQTQRGG